MRNERKREEGKKYLEHVSNLQTHDEKKKKTHTRTNNSFSLFPADLFPLFLPSLLLLLPFLLLPPPPPLLIFLLFLLSLLSFLLLPPPSCLTCVIFLPLVSFPSLIISSFSFYFIFPLRFLNFLLLVLFLLFLLLLISFQSYPPPPPPPPPLPPPSLSHSK